MIKRIISLILSAALLLSCLPTVIFAAKETDFIINESYENYPTNDLISTPVSNIGIDSRVIEMPDGNKVYYSKSESGSLKFTANVDRTYPQMVFSFDIMIDGARVTGEALSLKNGSSEFKMFSFGTNGEINLENGLHVSGYPNGLWKKYTVAVDFDRKCYDLYIDGRLQSSDIKFYTTRTVPVPKEIVFNFNCENESETTEVYFDNFTVYNGSEPLNDKVIPKKARNNEVVEFTPGVAEEVVYDTVFVDSNSKQGIGALSLVPLEDIAEWAPMEEGGTPYIHFVKTSKTGNYAELKPEMYEGLNKFVYQTDIYPVANPTGGIIICRFSDGDGKSSNLLYLTGSNVCVDTTAIAPIEFNKWTTVAAAVDLVKGECSVYINGELQKSKIPLPNSKPTKVAKFRMGFTSGSASYSEVYFNKIKVYDGLKLRTFEDNLDTSVLDDDFQIREQMKKTTNETAETAINMLEKDIVFMTSNSKLFAEGVKSDYSAYGKASYLSDDGKVMVDSEVFNKLLGTKLSGSADGFVDAAKEAKALNKYVYEDKRGFILISDKNRGYVNSLLDAANQEDIDLIYRYMHYDRPSGDDLYNAIVSSGNYQSHPRLYIKKDELPELRNRVNTNPQMKSALISLINRSDSYFDKEPTERVVTQGIRIFGSCVEVKTRLYDLCTTYLITQDKKYAERAWIELENCLNWVDFYLQNFLSSGELIPGVAFAYDTLYDYMTDEQKEFSRRKLEELYIDYSVGVYTGTSAYKALEYRQTQSNWGAVCGTAMFTIAAVLMDEEGPDSLFTEKCKYLASNALQSLEHIHTGVGPEGSRNEGLGYAEYVLEHTGWSFKTLMNTFNDDFEFFSAPGIRKYPDYMLYMQTQNGGFNCGGQGPTNPNKFCPEVFAFADLYNDMNRGALYYDFYHTLGMNDNIARYLLFCEPEKYANVDYSAVPLDKTYDSTGISLIKGSWEDDNALYLGIVGGEITEYGSAYHEKGSFVLDMIGERWSVDIGRYNSDKGYHETVVRTDLHSALVIDNDENRGQEFGKRAPVIKWESKPTEAMVVYDMTQMYGDKTNNYIRGFKVSDNRNSLTVQDELDLNGKRSLEWNFVTKADVKIDADSKGATLTQNGKKVRIDISCSAPDWKLEYTDLEPFIGWEDDTIKKFLNDTGKLRLVCEASGKVTISAKITPEIVGETFAPHTVTPIDSWVLSDKAMPAPAVLDGIYFDGVLMEGFTKSAREYKIEVPYGTKVPYITATAENGTVEIKQISNFTESPVIKLTMPDGRISEYSITFIVTERVSDNILGTKPQHGIPDGNKLIEVNSIYASPEPKQEYAAKYAIDDDMTTYWSIADKGAYMEIDLGAVYDLSGVALAFGSGGKRIYRYEILVSEDKMDYKRVYNGESVGGTLDYEFLPLGVKARYIRYVGNQHRTGAMNTVTQFRPTIAN